MLLLSNIDRYPLHSLFDRYGLDLVLVSPHQVIPGSYWGEREAGLIGARLFARLDTPIHSVLHEAAHFVCMSAERRAQLDTNALGNDAEESAVCYLQVLMGDQTQLIDRSRLFADMDEWGYSFRLGSAGTWFEHDAGDARNWLSSHEIIDHAQRLTYQCCQ